MSSSSSARFLRFDFCCAEICMYAVTIIITNSHINFNVRFKEFLDKMQRMYHTCLKENRAQCWYLVLSPSCMYHLCGCIVWVGTVIKNCGFENRNDTRILPRHGASTGLNTIYVVY